MAKALSKALRTYRYGVRGHHRFAKCNGFSLLEMSGILPQISMQFVPAALFLLCRKFI
jgi:hypothetical protein